MAFTSNPDKFILLAIVAFSSRIAHQLEQGIEVVDIYLNKAHFPVTVLGPGKRIGLWLQGCSLRCRGCISRDTWDRDDSHKISVEFLLDWCKSVSADGLDGVTISGGEPFEQPEALLVLLQGLTDWRNSLSQPFDILCYSGLPYSVLENNFANLLGFMDAIIPEPFLEDRPADGPWRGSANQPLLVLSEFGKSRDWQITDSPGGRHMQFVTDDERIWFIGVPRPGDMERLRGRLLEQGIELSSCSWKA